ncbi:MAG: TolC family protein [Acidobacteriales bacterium]|nr:TolC family protein [Terriglobales bacterium]
MLTLAALYYHADVAVARAGVRVAEAGVITGGARPNPSIAVAPGVAFDNAPSPWVFSITPTIPIETAGKRGYRIRAAERSTDAARLQLAETAWGVRARLRTSLLDFLSARIDLDQLRSEEQVRTEFAELIGRRFEFGDIPRPELDTAQIDLSNVRLAIRTGEGRIFQARVALASAIGIPVSLLDGVELVWPAFDQPPSESSLSADLIQRTAVLNRLDIRRSLAEYAVTEANLQLEIAKQYPDVQLGPGYNFDAGTNKYTLGVSVTLPLFNRNQGPIAEADARRKQAEERFLALQAQAIGDTQRALAGYRAALAELDEATVALKMQQEKERLVRKSFALGEADKLTLTGELLQSAVATRVRVTALGHVQDALGALESTVQKPLEPAWLVPNLPSSDNPRVDLLKEEHK